MKHSSGVKWKTRLNRFICPENSRIEFFWDNYDNIGTRLQWAKQTLPFHGAHGPNWIHLYWNIWRTKNQPCHRIARHQHCCFHCCCIRIRIQCRHRGYNFGSNLGLHICDLSSTNVKAVVATRQVDETFKMCPIRLHRIFKNYFSLDTRFFQVPCRFHFSIVCIFEWGKWYENVTPTSGTGLGAFHKYLTLQCVSVVQCC